MDRELLKLINEDDLLLNSEAELAESKKQTALLETIKEQTKPAPANNWMTVLKLDLNTAHDSYEVWKMYDGHPYVNSIVIPSQEIDFEYEIEPGKRVAIDAGLIMDVSGHDIKLIRITNKDTLDDIMDIVLSGYDPGKT